MHLESEIYNLVNNNIKDIEIRINDEKRRKLKIGDIITIINRGNNDTFKVKITNLEYFSSFNDCINNYDLKRLYNDKITKEELLNLLYKFYTKEEENKYGVVAIIFKKI